MLASGSFQQFTTPDALSRLMLPDIPLKTRVKWDSVARRYLRYQAEANRRWRDVQRELYKLLRRTRAEFGDWTEPPAELQEQRLD